MTQLLFCVVLVMPILAKAQILTLSGKVTDSESNLPLSFATITIRGSAIGTVSNVSGEFDFHFPASLREGTLVVSYLGYGSFSARIASLHLDESLSIRLRPAPVLLKEVMVEADDLSGKEIVGKAMAGIEKNYGIAPFCLQGFFREIEEENGKYVLLTEAALDVFDKGYGDKRVHGFGGVSVSLKEGRQSIRYSGRYDKDNPGFALADLLENNDVRYRRGMLDTATNTYSLDSILSYGDRSVYAVSMRNATDSGYLYIDTENYAIHSVAMERKSRDAHLKYYQLFEGDSLDIGRVYFRFTLSFREYQGKLYIHRMHESELNEIHDPETKSVRIASTESLEFITNQVLPGATRQDARPLNFRTKLDIGEYHEDFWASYNMLKLTPLNEKLISDLEREVSLKEQFKKPK